MVFIFFKLEYLVPKNFMATNWFENECLFVLHVQIIIIILSSNARVLWVVCSLSSIQRSIIFNHTLGKKRDSNFVSDKVSEKLYPRIIIESGYKRHFPHELAILSKSATQYVIQSFEKNAFKN